MPARRTGRTGTTEPLKLSNSADEVSWRKAMAWKVTLDFTGDSEPQLARTRFWADGSLREDPPNSEMVNSEGATPGDPNQQVFRWTAGVRALTVLLLRAFADDDPLRYRMQGGRGASAQPLAEAVTEKHAKGGTKTWIQKMFTPLAQAHPPNLIPGFFAARLNYENGSFWVRLGQNWREGQLEVFQNEQPIRQRSFVELAERIWPTGQPEVAPPQERVSGALRLSVLDPRTQQVMPLRDCALPLRAGSGIIIHAEMTRPAYVCVVWIDSRGHVQPLYPWRDFNWACPLATDKTTLLALPETHVGGKPSYYPVGVRSGIETAILLARDEPLPSSLGTDLPALLRVATVRYSSLRLHNPREPVEFASSSGPDPITPKVRLHPPQLVQDPFLPFRNVLLSRLSCRFAFVRVVAFAVAARSGSA